MGQDTGTRKITMQKKWKKSSSTLMVFLDRQVQDSQLYRKAASEAGDGRCIWNSNLLN